MLIKIKSAIICITLLTGLAACSKDKDKDDDDGDDVKIVTPKSDADGILVATINADSGVDQTIKASAGSAVDGASVTFSPGSLSVSTDITVETGLDIANAATLAQLGVDTGTTVTEASAALVVKSSATQVALTPFTIALPLSGGASLQGDDKLVVFAKYVGEDGTIHLSVKAALDITVEGKVAKIKTKHFGVFQAARSSVVIPATIEGTTSSPVTSLADLKPFFGVWKPICFSRDGGVSDMVWLTISAEGAVDDVKGYTSTDCSGAQSSSQKTTYAYSVGKEVTTEVGAKEADVTAVGGTLTALTDAQAAKYNAAKYCGFTDWKKDVVRDIANKKCDGEVKVPVGTTMYTIVKIEDGKLYFGLNEPGHESDTPATRNITLARDQPRTKQ